MTIIATLRKHILSDVRWPLRRSEGFSDDSRILQIVEFYAVSTFMAAIEDVAIEDYWEYL